VKVLLAEDSSVVRVLLKQVLTKWGYEIVFAEDGEAAWRVLERADSPRLALLDWMMPGPDGLELCQRVRKAAREPRVYIILLTGKDEQEDVVRGLGAGADDYLRKPFPVSELMARMRAVLRRRGRSARPVHVAGDLQVDVTAHIATRRGHDLELNRREFAILSALCQRAGSALSKAQLMADVWGDFDQFRMNVVEVHVSSLRRKLEAHGPRMIHTVRGIGYVLRP